MSESEQDTPRNWPDILNGSQIAYPTENLA
jgi:hypothetical protein